MRAVCDSLALANVPPPVTPVVQPNRFVKFGDAMICTVCQLDARYCRGHAPPSVSAAQDGQAAESLARRIKDCQSR